MSKSDTVIQLKQQKLVAVIRGENSAEGINASNACIKGGIKAIEVAYTNPEASDIIKVLNQTYKHDTDVIIGAGTVLDATTARLAILSGARYIVSPSFHQETALMCHLYNVLYIPGCFTLTEITTALESGCEIIKLFPGNAISPSYVSAIKAPIPQVSIMVTGGVNLQNATDWLNAGVDAIGIGGEFNKLAAKQDFEAITTLAQDYRHLV
ncbi:bifunctional 4-hydroxy-2-oxoglutarate aldolase/2-dehydro-3-deoxy-phosphogluconate aldolase [Carnobacteriaceae bacterium zg-ZUI78]|uniref:bifunctional 4-hydroxy-2-oxoglutarate aldolase/2-dehydro-3-deoxy-phosphogluconate aldolase n=1 Tax=Granulicatella sp. zg-84 TaxID=2678503 RepID=UPI0013C1E583|nr:bifunctional 4-hydroxy-2-oxoglutarate aldolase/2-dehydro-3-deoxy-phosphogluconate aldolase [Granulicatella sp. zg-84]MBS4750791.1 bifunctional 4-hydroxy-2-oxoglutarate aldolase/2-dehydro-3-deoxy-phosphogluconate aldolase [Carnobacteriaceae bacterium zg-ZUI78]NEW66509.1 bifunctional 4-hydroxy-2-oxoglutarate aldolase/2-dehydro-3-deoxy-phosphogluconate aldolase [Granulicatella sp. zg-84]QMI85503.1 bifunctional 4-hydroxy-2-oxoglutarate aldolase/2-dehydro-3-deoxy-phosphogluconate aldolase [Carnoba